MIAEQGFSPLDEQLHLWEKHWSEGVVKEAGWWSGIVDFETAEEILQQAGQMAISDSSVWRQTQKWGQQFQAVEETERIRFG